MKCRVLLLLLSVPLIISLAGLHPDIARAESRSPPPKIWVYDFGRSSCGLWLEARANRASANDVRFIQAREWISGFLTAYNMYVHSHGDVAGQTDQEGLHAWLDGDCRRDPTNSLMSAVFRLIKHLDSR